MAEELIELGRGEALSRDVGKPFFLGRVRLSDGREAAQDYLGQKFRDGLGVLDRLSGSGSLSEAIQKAGVIREVVAETLVLGGAIMKSLGGHEAHALGHVLEALEGSGTEVENGALLETAAGRLVLGAPVQVKSAVEEILGVG
jgi:hypothetical protein